MTIRDKTCIVGVGLTEYGLRGQLAEKSQIELLGAALDEALEDCGLTRSDVDGFSSYSGDLNDPGMLAPALGIPDVNYSGMVFGGGGGGGCAAVANAAAAVAAGYARVVMVYKIITQPPHARFGASYGRAGRADPRSDFHRPFGLVAPGQFFSLFFRRHMYEYGTKPESLAEIAVAQREHALRNPKALMRTPLTIEDHQNSRLIADPFRLFDYCQENDGGGVVIVTSADNAKSLKQKPIYIMAAAMGGDSKWGHALTSQNAAGEIYASSGHRHLAKRLYEMAGIGPNDIDVCELYDHFSGLVMLQLEDYGFCKIGEGGDFVADGGIRWDKGRMPTNTHGGNLSEVYLLGMTHMVEAVMQLRGNANSQIPNAEIALVTSGPSSLSTSSMILRR